MNATKEWQEYDHDYEKDFQDIRTKDGKEYVNCWPNAGKWIVLNDKKGLRIPDGEVTHVRLTDEKDID
jgi:hypothetical protein